MMKKFLVILAVMAIAPLASATLGDLVLDFGDRQVDSYGNYIAEIGEEVTVTVVQTIPTPNGTGGEMGIKFDGEVTEVVDLTPSLPEGFWNWEVDLGIEQSDEVGGITFTKIGSLSYGTPGMGSQSPLGHPYVGTVQFSFIVTGPTDLEWIGIWDGVDMTGEIGASIVPEPITIALLSLGAIFTRRRK